MKRRVKWFAVEAAPGEEWTVYLVPPSNRELNIGGKAVGCAMFGRLEVYVSWAQTESEVYATAIHELLHVAIHRAGLPGQWEEQLVAMVEPLLIRMLATAPVAFPPIPDSVERFVKTDRCPPFVVQTTDDAA